MKILYLVTDDFYFLGHRRCLAEAALRAGLEVIVATAPGEKSSTIEEAGFQYRPVRLLRTLNPLRAFLGWLDIVRLYRRERPDIVHHVSLRPVVYGSWAARFVPGTRVVNALTGLGFVFTREGSQRRFLRWAVEAGLRVALAGRNRKTIFQNPDDRALFAERKLGRMDDSETILGSGVDPERFRPSAEPDGPITVLLPARMLWHKGVGTLIEAARLLRDRGQPLRVVLAGQPDPLNPGTITQKELEAWVSEGIAEWIGHQAEMTSVYAAAHLVCLPSYYREGVPLSLIEAASCGKPIVTTDVPGCREIVRSGENGLLVTPQDPPALAAALAKLAESRSLRAAFGAAGRQRVLDDFSADRVISQTFDVYASLIPAARGPLSTPRTGPAGSPPKPPAKAGVPSSDETAVR